MLEYVQDLLVLLQDEFMAFTGLKNLLNVVMSEQQDWVFTIEGFRMLVGFLVPTVVFLEMAISGVKGKFRWKNFRIPIFTYFLNRVLVKVITLYVGIWLLTLLHPYRLIDTGVTWYWLIYAYLVYEFSHFIYHYTCHKVRILWCLHSTHHVPTHMNLSLSWSHFILEAPYADILRIGACGLAGVELPVLLMVFIGDGIWGHIIHVSEEVLPDGRLGFLNKILLTPSHHRVHHSKNPQYIDKNFCNLLPIFDRLFGTYQDEIKGEKPVYGITRDVNPQSLMDSYFGEITGLYCDIKNTSGIGNKIAYLFMPPGWHPASVLAAKDALEEKT